MEKALLITPSEADGLLAGRKAGAAAAAAGRRPSGFSALIVGSEFCQNQAPTLSVLKRLAQRFPGVKLGLATSILTDKGLRRWEELFDSLKGKGIVAEVIVNDWGLFPVLERTGPFKISSGRLLTRKLARLDGRWVSGFIKERGLSAAEADDPEQAAAAAGLGLAVSWHGQLSFKAVTTFCPFEKHFNSRCSHSCEGRLEPLSNRLIPFPLLLCEKAYFSPPGKGGGRPKAPWREITTLNFTMNLRRSGRPAAYGRTALSRADK